MTTSGIPVTDFDGNPRTKWTTDEELEVLVDKLRASIPDGAVDQAQAVEMLCRAYGGALLAISRVQQHLIEDGDRIRIQWPSLLSETATWQHATPSRRSHIGIPSTSADRIVRFAHLLYTGELTSHELGVVGTAYRSAAGVGGAQSS